MRWLALLLCLASPVVVISVLTAVQRPRCPQCRGHLHVTEVVVRPPLPDLPGSGIRSRKCERCGYSHEVDYAIPFIGEIRDNRLRTKADVAVFESDDFRPDYNHHGIGADS